MDVLVWLLITGAVAGILGAMVGVGGGFVAVPIMTMFFGLSPQLIVGTSLTMTFFTALSSLLFLWRQGRIDLQTGWRFAAATVPGAVLGSQAASYFSDRSFQIAFGCLMLAVSLLMWYRREPGSFAPPKGLEDVPKKRGSITRIIVDAAGIEFRYHFNLYLGIGLSLAVGFISSIMGIGGGIIHVPLLVLALRFPPHLAASTSLFVLGWSSLVGSITHFLLGHTDLRYAAALALGGLLGAQVGIRIASRLPGVLMVRIFSLMMAAVGIRLIFS